ncbi:hypothetical protein B0H10DRAFT_1075038 [Mycena sp. CBHHK59/15]|nr:hypothetical protein B0H10DRAFT_1075038 [Mycena sp. CBHHK59/15]
MCFNDLPEEIIMEIFLHFATGGTTVTQPSAKAGPLLLIQVCSVWRRVGLAMQELWSSLAIVTASSHNIPHLELVRLWLVRSGVQPLSLVLTCPVGSGGDPKEAFDLLLTQFNRWKDVEISIDADVAPVCSDIIRGVDTPFLENLSLAWNEGIEDETCVFSLTAAPRLVTLLWAVFDRNPRTAQIPWSQLIELYLANPTGQEDVIYVFQHCPLLEICYFGSLDLADPASVDAPLSPPVLLSNLRQLTLDSTWYWSPVSFILNSLILPNLEELDISLETGVRWDQAGFASGFASLISRSQCSLETLSLRGVHLQGDDLVPCIQTVSDSLKTLKIYNTDDLLVVVNDNHLSLLTYGAFAENICPRLTSITLERCLYSSDGALAKMIESRWKISGNQGLAALRNISVSFGDTQQALGHTEDYRRAEQLREEGLDVLLNPVL